MLRVLGVVPARGGSKGIPRKNLAMLYGKPVIEWTVEAAKLSYGLAHIVVSSDDEEVERLARKRWNVKFIPRPSELATDDAKTVDVVRHAFEWCNSLGPTSQPYYDAVFCLQPTNPLRTAADIDGAISLMERTGCDSVISFTLCTDAHPARMCQLDGDKAPVQDFTRRQDLPPYYLRDGSVYLVKREVLMAGSMVGNDCRAWIIPRERACNIDGPEDLDVAEVRMRRLQCAS